jgi:hypothetical protein
MYTLCSPRVLSSRDFMLFEHSGRLGWAFVLRRGCISVEDRRWVEHDCLDGLQVTVRSLASAR